MKERPILFSGEMVRAILDGQKTQTRRIVKPRKGYRIAEKAAGTGRTGISHILCRDASGNPAVREWPSQKINDHAVWCHKLDELGNWDGFQGTALDCPYGKPGDRLWVRETFGDMGFAKLDVDGITYRNVYRADFPDDYDGFGLVDGWKPSIFMPRNLCRILLEVVSVRVERLNAISDIDAVAEGVELIPSVGIMRACGWKDYTGDGMGFFDPVDSYRSLWESINGALGPKSWDENPFVWVVGFKRAEA
ncbi:MAG: hypothetical protein V4671_19385 [Armatimonadota bacterium]